MSNQEDSLIVDTSYDVVTPDEAMVDSDNNVTVVDPSSTTVTPFDVIKKTAETIGQTILDPKAGCKYCYGRGYVGRKSGTGEPVPCKCIYPDFNSDKNNSFYNRTRKHSRKERRQMDKDTRKRSKRGQI